MPVPGTPGQMAPAQNVVNVGPGYAMSIGQVVDGGGSSGVVVQGGVVTSPFYESPNPPQQAKSDAPQQVVMVNASPARSDDPDTQRNGGMEMETELV